MATLMKNAKQFRQPQRNSAPTQDMCEHCGKKPKFVERGYTHPYCSRSCAREIAKLQAAPAPTQAKLAPAQTPSPPKANTCRLHGCQIAGTSAFSGFCSDGHAKNAIAYGQASVCNVCGVKPATGGLSRGVCNDCSSQNQASNTYPRLREVDSRDKVFQEVSDRFVNAWSGQKKLPIVDKVYEVLSHFNSHRQHQAYQASLKPSNEVQTYHGSQCICDMGTNGPVFCTFQSCGICNIARSSFKEHAFGKPYNEGRFGKGIYSYTNSAKADEFVTSCTSSPYRVVIACDTTLGTNVSVTPYESIFVPSSDAIMPRYLIMYVES